MKLKLDPRTKMLLLVIINVVMFTSPDLATEWVCMGAIALLLVCMGAYRQAARGVILYCGMMAALWASQFLPAMPAAVISMMVICFRKVVPALVFAAGLAATTKVGELISALQAMHVPKAVVVPFAVTLRFFPTVKEEYACIKDAMKLRGIGLSAKNLLTRPLTVAECVFVPMMMRCAGIAEELSAAAVTRGIDSEQPRTSMFTLSLRMGDAVGAMASVALIAVIAMGGVGALHG